MVKYRNKRTGEIRDFHGPIKSVNWEAVTPPTTPSPGESKKKTVSKKGKK